MVLLSDGAPTYSAKASGYTGSVATNNLRLTFDSLPATGDIGAGNSHHLFQTTAEDARAAGDTHYYTGTRTIKGYSLNNKSLYVSNHRLPTASYGQDLKKDGIEIYSVGFANGTETWEAAGLTSLSGTTGQKLMTTSHESDMDAMMTAIASSPKHFYKSSDYAKLLAQLKEIAGTMNYAVRMGTLNENVNQENFVIADDFKPTVKRFNIVAGKEVDSDEDSFEFDPEAAKSGNITVSNVSLGRDQGIELTYRVHIRTERDDFKAGYLYPTNTGSVENGFDAATFKPIADKDDLLDFPVVSAKAPGAEIAVEKTWICGGDLPESIDLNLIRESDTMEDDQWTGVGTLTNEN